MSVRIKAYRDDNGEIIRVEEGSFQELDCIAGGLTELPGASFDLSNDLLNNETLDAKLDDSQLIDDDTFASATDQNIPTAESVKAYVDSNVNNGFRYKGKLNAGTGSLPVSATVGDVYLIEGSGDSLGNIRGDDDLSPNDFIVYLNAENDNDPTNPQNWAPFQRNDDDDGTAQFVADMYAILGISPGDTDFGTFTGSTLSDNLSAKQLFQELENAIEAQNEASEISYDNSTSGLTATDVQAAIDELDTQIDILNGEESTLSFNTVSNILTHTSNQGTVSNIDLSQYLDDTNLARLVSGTLDAGTGIATFTRDDATTFTLDLSSLLDNQNANEVPYDNSTSGLTATNVQAAIDENDSRLDALEAISKEYVYANQTVAQTGINGTAVNVVFDNTAKNSNASVFSVNNTTGEIIINKISTFKIEYIITADTEDGARRTSETTLEIDTGSGFAPLSAALGSATAYGYHRNNASGENTATGQAILDLNSGDVIRLRIRRSNGNGVIRTVPSGISISIEEK